MTLIARDYRASGRDYRCAGVRHMGGYRAIRDRTPRHIVKRLNASLMRRRGAVIFQLVD